MALATQCPHCNTLFRVAQDQLKLRGGIVRCGACNEIFDGNASLIDLDVVKETPVPTPAAAAAAVSASAAFDAQIAALEQQQARPDPEPIYTLDFDTTFDPFGILPKTGSDSAGTPAPHANQAQLGLRAATPDDPPLDLDFDIGDDSLPTPQPSASPRADASLQLQIDAEPAAERAAADLAAKLARAEAQADAERAASERAAAAERAAAERSLAERLASERALAERIAAELAAARAQADAAAHAAAHPAASAAEGASAAPATGEHYLGEPPAAAEDDDADFIIDLPSAGAPPPPLALDLPPAESEEPGFVRRSREQARATRTRRILMGIGSVLLLASALGQTTYLFRNELAARVPALRALLADGCHLLGCQVQLPTQIELLTIDLGELQTLPGGMFSLTTQLHNQSRLTQTWPHIELLLNDGEKPLLRRVITPGDYLAPPIDPARGFPAHSEQNIKLFFQLDQIKASGYGLVVFYP